MDADPCNADATLNFNNAPLLDRVLQRGCRVDTDRDGGKAAWVGLIELGAWHRQQCGDLGAEPLGLSGVTFSWGGGHAGDCHGGLGGHREVVPNERTIWVVLD